MRASRHPLFRVGAALLATAGAAWGGSLPSVTSGARPGPDILYAPPPPAPQLENRNPRFTAPPLLVSGQEAYVLGSTSTRTSCTTTTEATRTGRAPAGSARASATSTTRRTPRGTA